MAVADADYQFLFVDVGAQGSISDGGVFQNCSFQKDLYSGRLNLPPSKPLPGGHIPVSYVIVADDAFALSKNLLKPYPGDHDENSPERRFNQRLSRARTRIENAFGILSSRFRVLRQPMHLSEKTARLVVLTTCYLHNFIRHYASQFEDEVVAEVLRGINNTTIIS